MRKARLVPLCVFNAVLLNQELTASASISSKYDFIHRGLHENKRMYAWSMLFLISSAPTVVPRKYKAFTQKAGITKQFVEAHLALPRRICYESLGQKRFPWLLKSEMLQVCFSHLTWGKNKKGEEIQEKWGKGQKREMTSLGVYHICRMTRTFVPVLRLIMATKTVWMTGRDTPNFGGNKTISGSRNCEGRK